MSAPDWIVIKKMSEVSIPREKLQIDMETWPLIARERMSKFVNNKKWFPAEGANRGNYDQEIYEEYAGHGLLRIVASEDSRVMGWLVEQEGDLFEWRIKKAKTIEEKLAVARYIFGIENVIGPRDLWARFDINQHYFKEFKMGNKRTGSIAVHFTCVPKMISNRSALLKNGWVIAQIDVFAGSLKSAFEKTLRQKIRESKDNIDSLARSSISEPINKLKEELSKVIRTFSRNSSIQLGEYRLYTRQSVFPQCMLDLYNEVMNKGHISHQERFQLGLFLKNIGMTVEEQLEFWYEKAVDNIGMTFERFAAGPAGYQIKYMYGLAGGGTDYSAHKCESIQDDSYCTFLHQSVQTIDENLRKEFKNIPRWKEDLIREVERKVINKKPSEACALVFQLRYGRKAHPIKHPISYLRYAARTLEIIEHKKKDEKATEVEKNKEGKE